MVLQLTHVLWLLCVSSLTAIFEGEMSTGLSKPLRVSGLKQKQKKKKNSCWKKTCKDHPWSLTHHYITAKLQNWTHHNAGKQTGTDLSLQLLDKIKQPRTDLSFLDKIKQPSTDLSLLVKIKQPSTDLSLLIKIKQPSTDLSLQLPG